MLRHFKLVLLMARLSVQNDVAYRLDFFAHLLAKVLQLGGELMGLWTIFSNTRAIAGWDVWQVIVLLGVFRFMTGLIGTFIAPNMRRIMEDIRQGTLDFVLVKPVNSQFFVSVRQVVVWRVIDLVIGLGLAIIGARQVGAETGPGQLGLFLVMLAAGATVIYSFWLVLATLVFWITRMDNIEFVFWNVYEAGRYPIDIYRPWVQWLLTYILPLAFLTTFPASILAGRQGGAAVVAALIVAPLSLLAASAFWRFGLRHYSGASA